MTRLAWLGIILLPLGACSSSSDDEQDAKVTTDGPATDGPKSDATRDGGQSNGDGNPAGTSCAKDSECQSKVCYEQTCAKACTKPEDCASTEDCTTDDGQRLFCHVPAYKKGIGAECAVTGECPSGGMYIIYNGSYEEDAEAYCSAECTTSVDCPMDFICASVGGTNLCVRQRYCDRCLHDGQCPGNGRCIQQGAERFCTQPCHAGSTECPRFAKCEDVGAGDYQCLHKAGTCAGTGELCQPCVASGDCDTGGMCLAWLGTGEMFCGQDCSSKSCPSGNYKCAPETQQCVPTSSGVPSCVTLSPTMEVGDIMNDFAIVGYTDSDGDHSLSDETLQLIKLSDFESSAKIILFNVVASWCPPCKAETATFKNLMTTYGPQGLMIFQVLYDAGTSSSERVPPTKTALTSWINAYSPDGTCGLDYRGNCIPLNTDGSTPLNMILDAKTRKVLSKFYTSAFLVSEIQKHLK